MGDRNLAMTTLTPDQRNYYYLLEAERTGIHKPILAALYQVQGKPSLTDRETGLGISPANRVPLEAVKAFPAQVKYAANAIRSLADFLETQDWTGSDLWNAEKGGYTDRFVQKVAQGYLPKPSESEEARLEACNPIALMAAYLQDSAIDFHGSALPQNQIYLDRALLTFVERIPEYYRGLAHQRDALLEAVRIWAHLDDRETAIASLAPKAIASLKEGKINDAANDSQIDIPLKQFLRRISPNYSGYPYQREALIRLTQLWRRLPSREAAIASLATNSSPEENLKILDPALIAFIQRLPLDYQGKGSQRNALTEMLRLWHQLDSRTTALITLGIDPAQLQASSTDQITLANSAAQLDRELLAFIRRLPGEYQELDHQREALIRLIQLWRTLGSRAQTIQSLIDDLQHLDKVRRHDPQAPPQPLPLILLRRPSRWTPDNIQIFAPIIPDGSFTWAEATHGGTWMPPDGATVDAVVRIAQLAQQARDRISRPFLVTSWYRPPHINRAVGGAIHSRHLVGDAIDFTCEGLSGDQIYWFLEPWWPGGLGRYTKFPHLCHIDARSYRARW